MEITPSFLLNLLVLVIGAFIKMELHGINYRIQRLENIFMKRKDDEHERD